MSDTVKLIIEIPKETVSAMKTNENIDIQDLNEAIKSIENGTPFDSVIEDIKAEKPETCKGCLEPCIMYEPDMRACKHKVTEKGGE